jgi:hypothetical protein
VPPIQFVPDTICSRYNLCPIQFVPIKFVPIQIVPIQFVPIQFVHEPLILCASLLKNHLRCTCSVPNHMLHVYMKNFSLVGQLKGCYSYYHGVRNRWLVTHSYNPTMPTVFPLSFSYSFRTGRNLAFCKQVHWWKYPLS